MTNNCEFHVVLLIIKFVTVYEISQFNQSFKTVLSYKVSSEMFMCQCSKPWPHSDIRSCCHQSVCVFTFMYDSTLLDRLYYAESKVLQHEMVSYTCMCVYTHQLYYHQVRQYLISLGTLVPNSRDRHEKQWRPDFTRHKTHPKIRFV